MNIKQTRDQIISELEKHIDTEYKDGATRYFKEQVKVWGVRTNDVKKIVSLIFKDLVKDLPKKELFKLAESLLKLGHLETNILL